MKIISPLIYSLTESWKLSTKYLDRAKDELEYAEHLAKGCFSMLDEAILNEIMIAYPGLKFVEISCFMDGVKGYLYREYPDHVCILYKIKKWRTPEEIEIEECALSSLGKGMIKELVKKLGTVTVGRVT